MKFTNYGVSVKIIPTEEPVLHTFWFKLGGRRKVKITCLYSDYINFMLYGAVVSRHASMLSAQLCAFERAFRSEKI